MAIHYESVDWRLPERLEGHVDAVTVARLERAPYRAAVPVWIRDLDPLDLLDPRVIRDVTRAEGMIAAFDREVADLPVPMPAVLLRTESASSSQIEHLTSNARNLAMANLGLTAGQNAALVAGNVRAMRASLNVAGPFSSATILSIHRALLEESEPDIAGVWRDGPVWIGRPNVSPHGADFVPPVFTRVPELIEDLVEFASAPHESPLAAAIIAHAQFETIHPFSDGNGRTGRALIHTVLRDARVSSKATVPISAGLLGDTEAYFAALTAFREGDASPIANAFVDATQRAVVNGRILASETAAIRERWRSTISARSDAGAWRLADYLFEQPVVSAEHVERALAISRTAAFTAIETLEKAGALTQTSRDRRNRLWQAPQVLAAMDAFAARAVRRRL